MSASRLPADNLERVSSWGNNLHTLGYVFRPVDEEGIREVFALARKNGVSVGLRGAGCSYGDAALNREQIVLDTSRMNRILVWDKTAGLLTVEGGVTLEQVWRHVLPDGWWPPVVSGTMRVSVAGALAMNIHGKNHSHAGTLGENTVSFDLLLPSGKIMTCGPDNAHSDLFYAAVGGMGMLGVILRATLQMRPVGSGLLRLQSFSVSNWSELFALFEEKASDADYLVGWIDGFARGKSAGRGRIERADFLKPGDDPAPQQTLRTEYQNLSDSVLGFVPKSVLWRLVKPFFNQSGMRLLNAAQFYLSKLKNGAVRWETHAGFQFMLDYVPHWKRAYGPGGLVQYQAFVPKNEARRVFAAQIALCQKAGMVPLLCVFKKHRPADKFLLSYSGDGYSLALDFKHTSTNHDALFALAAEMDALVLEAGGRFYLAKDSTLHASRLGNFLGEGRVRKFRELKAKYDPGNLLQTDLWRRVFAD